MYQLMACVGKVKCFISKGEDLERLAETAKQVSQTLPNRGLVILEDGETVWRHEPETGALNGVGAPCPRRPHGEPGRRSGR